MIRTLKILVEIQAREAYVAGVACHGDLGIDPDLYADHLISVTEKYLGTSAPVSSVSKFVKSLNTSDLYLSVACAKPTNLAWERFNLMYGLFIAKLTASTCATVDAARTVADSIPGHIFLPDASGRSRIASYEGRSSLASWLSVVISHKATKERRRCRNLDQLDYLPDMTDDGSATIALDADYRASAYQVLTKESFRAAGCSLTERERLIVALRYEDDLHATEIAAILKVHPSTVSRSLQQVYLKLQSRTVKHLGARQGLRTLAIRECLDDIRENPAYSILSLLAGVA